MLHREGREVTAMNSFGISDRDGAATWILVADSHRARVLGAPGPFTPLEELDAIERAETGTGIPVDRSSASREQRATGSKCRMYLVTAQSAADFARAIGAYLDYQHGGGRFERLVLVAPPPMLAMLQGMLTPRVRERLELDMEADLVDDNPASIRARLPGVI
jgi:protein required for attachment to host cells